MRGTVHIASEHPCRENLRGDAARCNGGGRDGCACGPYSVADYREMERRSWTRQVGDTLYRPSTDPSDWVGAKVVDATIDGLTLENPLTHRKFVVSLQVAMGDAVEEFKEVERLDYDEARADAGLIQ